MDGMKLRTAALAAALIAAAAASACGEDGWLAARPVNPRSFEKESRATGTLYGATVYSKDILSQTYSIDRIYKSMTGPMDTIRLEIEPGEPPELLWVTGFEAVMRAPDGEREMSQEFMCHSNLSIRDGPGTAYQFPTSIRLSDGRLFTLAQGQLSIRLPEGFGVPVLSNQTVQIAAQVLNHNVVDRPFSVRHRITVDFVRDRELTRPLTPLMPRAVFGMKLISGPDGYYDLREAEIDAKLHGEGCSVGMDAGAPLSPSVKDSEGRTFTGHWVVKPGREENHTLVTKRLALPYDTTLHYVAVHVHPFAESVELRDLTSGTSVYTSHARQTPGRVGLADVESFSSPRGIPLYKDHEYELVSVYNNTSGVDQDAMATMFLYLEAKDFDVERFRRAAVPSRVTVAP